MQIASVIGRTNATIKHSALNGWKLLIVQPLDLVGGDDGDPQIAIDHLGSYACRDINRGEGAASGDNAASGARSRHATANAFDIAGFTLENGRRISILKEWKSGDTTAAPGTEAQMLADVHKGACRFFDGVLGPDYNAVHRDHFHLETGGYSMCR